MTAPVTLPPCIDDAAETHDGHDWQDGACRVCLCPAPAGLTLNETLRLLGYTVRTDVHARSGLRIKTVLLDGEAIRFEAGTLSGDYRWVTDMNGTSAGRVWSWLRATGQIR